MSKPIPPPPPPPRTTRPRSSDTPHSIGARRVLRDAHEVDTLDDHPAPPEYRPLNAYLTPGGPRLITSNMEAASSALGIRGEKAAKRKAERDNKRTEYVGRTVKTLHPTARLNDR